VWSKVYLILFNFTNYDYYLIIFKCNIRLARGDTVAEIQEHSTVEGIATARVAVKYADACNLKLPIFR
jgi:hypothetical protein